MAKRSGRPAPTTPKDAARIQRAQARKSGGVVHKGSFAARAQRAAAKKR